VHGGMSHLVCLTVTQRQLLCRQLPIGMGVWSQALEIIQQNHHRVLYETMEAPADSAVADGGVGACAPIGQFCVTMRGRRDESHQPSTCAARQHPTAEAGDASLPSRLCHWLPTLVESEMPLLRQMQE
jgi:hypothetical protein